MIRIEVTSEADVTRMVAAFVTLPVLQDCDYEIWLAGPALASQPWGAGCVRRAWREDGRRGATGPSDWRDAGEPAARKASSGPGWPRETPPEGAHGLHHDHAGRYWAMDSDDRWWIQPRPDTPWYPSFPETMGGEQP